MVAIEASWEESLAHPSGIVNGEVESWHSGQNPYLQFPVVKPYGGFCEIRLSDYLPPGAFAQGAFVGTSNRPSES